MDAEHITRQELERDIVMAYLDKERDIWIGARALLQEEPCGENYEARNRSMLRIDLLLDELNGGITVVTEMPHGNSTAA